MTEKLEILFEDNHILAVNKPPRILTASDRTGDVTMMKMVTEYYHGERKSEGKGYIVPLHFLDRPVSGVLMFAKTSKAAARLNEQIRSHKMEKVYFTVVEGEMMEEEGELSAFLKKDRKKNITKEVSEEVFKAKESILKFRCLARKKGFSFLEVRPATGRSHQIRVLLTGAGFPIYGDVKYGATKEWENKIMLHAFSLTFAHPVKKDMMTVKAPLPNDWEDVWPKINSNIGNQS